MDKEIWKNPGLEKSLDESQAPLWFWNDKLEKEELLRQLKLKTSVGVKCTIPHARMNHGDGYIGGYLDDDWFEKINVVLEYKKRQGEPVWLYDEMDWPAGTCNKTLTLEENNREHYLSFRRVDIEAGEVFRAQLIELHGFSLEGKEKGKTKRYAYNVCILDTETWTPYEIENYIKYSYIGATIDFCAKKRAVAYIVTICVDTYDGWGAGCVNYLDASVTKKFLMSTYDKYYERFSKYFGNTIRCVFDDETRMANAFPWLKSFPEEFRRRKGYDFLPEIFSLVLPGVEAGKVRCDYYDVIASLFQENYFKILQEWCHAHGIQLYAHLLGEETLASQVRFSGDFLRQMRYLDICGADHLGKGIGSLNIKFAVSAARSYGKTRTAVEVFAGCGWEMTFEEYIRIISWMFQQGMQIIINHGFFYSTRDTRKNDWPPSQFFQWQGWSRMQEGNDMIRRLHYALTDGIPETDILIYVPTESFWMDYIGDEFYKHGYNEGPLVRGQNAAEIDKEMQYLLNGLLVENLDYDLLHKDALSNFEVKGNGICNKANGQKFSVLILPMCRMISIGALQLAAQFVHNGGKVILLEDTPQYTMESGTGEKFKELVAEFMASPNVERISIKNKSVLYQRLKDYLTRPVQIVAGNENNRNYHTCYENGLVDPYLHTGEDIAGIRFVRYRKNGRCNVFFMNYDNTPRQIQVDIQAEGELELWNTFTGEITTPVEMDISRNKKSDFRRVSFELPCNYGIILVMDL